MGIMGGGKDRKAVDPNNPPKGFVKNPALVYHGNPQNMDAGFRTPQSSPFMRESLVTGATTPKKDKNSLMTRRY